MNLSANKLKTLPSSIGNLTGLTSLALDANQLTCPPQRLARLPGGLRRILNWFKNEYPPLVKAQRALFGQRIKEQCEPFHTSFPNVYQSICALVPDPTREPIGAPVNLAQLDAAVVARMGRFVHSLHPGQPSVVDVEDKVLFGRIYGWMMLSPAFQAPTQMYAKDLIAIRLENWLDAMLAYHLPRRFRNRHGPLFAIDPLPTTGRVQLRPCDYEELVWVVPMLLGQPLLVALVFWDLNSE